jgi:cupin 2 domain-containing protein
MGSRGNIFDALPSNPPAEEMFAPLLVAANELRVERIVSFGHASPPGFWYDQPEAEWVVLLGGSARLRFEDDPDAIELIPGAYVDIAAHRRHRVEWTAPGVPTVWLAIHYKTRDG